MFDDFKSCYKRLLFFDNLIVQIIQKIGAHSQLSGKEKEETQKLLKELRNELKKDQMFMSDVEVQDTLSEIDKYLYFPAVQQALSKMNIKTSSIPDQIWVGQLYEVQEEIKQCMGKVENYL